MTRLIYDIYIYHTARTDIIQIQIQYSNEFSLTVSQYHCNTLYFDNQTMTDNMLLTASLSLYCSRLVHYFAFSRAQWFACCGASARSTNGTTVMVPARLTVRAPNPLQNSRTPPILYKSPTAVRRSLPWPC